MAKKAQLVAVLSGEDEARKRAEAIMVPATCRQAIQLGSDVSAAAKLKLIGSTCMPSFAGSFAW
jgi:methionyl-tRNA formyltransferase